MAAGQSGQALDAGMARELIELGIVSPVTKQSAGKQYHEQLSRQLAEFLEKQLRREKGMMVLHDVYCLFNRYVERICHRNKKSNPSCLLCVPCTFTHTGVKINCNVSLLKLSALPSQQMC